MWQSNALLVAEADNLFMHEEIYTSGTRAYIMRNSKHAHLATAEVHNRSKLTFAMIMKYKDPVFNNISMWWKK